MSTKTPSSKAALRRQDLLEIAVEILKTIQEVINPLHRMPFAVGQRIKVHSTRGVQIGVLISLNYHFLVIEYARTNGKAEGATEWMVINRSEIVEILPSPSMEDPR